METRLNIFPWLSLYLTGWTRWTPPTLYNGVAFGASSAALLSWIRRLSGRTRGSDKKVPGCGAECTKPCARSLLRCLHTVSLTSIWGTFDFSIITQVIRTIRPLSLVDNCIVCHNIKELKQPPRQQQRKRLFKTTLILLCFIQFVKCWSQKWSVTYRIGLVSHLGVVWTGQLRVLGNCPPTPPLTQNCLQWEVTDNANLGEGEVGSFSET